MVTHTPRKDAKKVNLSLTLDADVLNGVKEASWRKRKNRSRLINDILTDWLSARGLLGAVNDKGEPL